LIDTQGGSNLKKVEKHWNKPWIHISPGTPFVNGKRKYKEIKIVTWNTLSLYCTGACQNLDDVLKEYSLDLNIVQRS